MNDDDLTGAGHAGGVESVTQSSVPAAGAPPVATSAPNSVFALGLAAAAAGGGDVAPPQQPGETEPAALNKASRLALAILRKAGGEMSFSAFKQQYGSTVGAARDLLSRLSKQELITIRKDGRKAFYKAAQSGFNRWLRERAQESAEGHPKRRGRPPGKGKAAARTVVSATPKAASVRKPRAKAPARAVEPAEAPILACPAATRPPGLVCGLFSSGEVVIESEEDGHLRLKPDQARYLIAWLLKVDAALRP